MAESDITKNALNEINNYLNGDQAKQTAGIDPMTEATGMEKTLAALIATGISLPADLVSKSPDEIAKRIADPKDSNKIDTSKLADVAKEIKAAITGGEDAHTASNQSSLPNNERSKPLQK